MTVSRLVALCPAGAVSGGPEALHQLVHTAARLGFDASIAYMGDPSAAHTPAAFAHYDVAVTSTVPDEPDVLIVVPEIYAHVLLGLEHAALGLWWLSVDWLEHWNGRFQDQFGTPLRPLDAMHRNPRVLHLAQSRYASDHVLAHGGTPVMLTDYLHESLRTRLDLAGAQTKSDAVAYNPAKGFEVTSELMALAPELEWVALQGMSAAELAGALGRCKAYVDFGHHPGRDRIPREAALAGACVVVGRRGSADNDVDVPIDGRYKLPATCPPARAVELLRDVVRDHAGHSAQFDPYRSWITRHECDFADEVRGVMAAADALPAALDGQWVA